jgi:CheY-like chemotaxis protein
MATVTKNVCLLISNSPMEQAIFSLALSDVCPDSICIVAHDEEEALNLLQGAELKPDLIFVDFWFPGFSGVRFTRRIKGMSKLRSTPVILHCNAKDALEGAQDCGADALYCKDYTFEGLRNILFFYSMAEAAPMLN